LIPFIGVLIFLIFGSNYINIKEHRADFEKSKAKFSNFENLDFSNQLISKDTAATNIFKYSFVSQKAAITNRNSTEIIEENQDLYSTYMDAIRQAKHFIHFRTYIIRDGMFLFSLASELIKKAKEGVKVRFMYD
jgi:cardiolipin synthase